MTPAPASPPQRKIIKNAGTVTGFTLLSRVLGAVRDLVIAHFFGAGWVTDAFVQAFTIPNVLRRLTAEGAMTQVFIPLYMEVREKEERAAAKVFASKTLGMVLLGTAVLTLIGILFAPQLVLLFAAGFREDPAQFQLCVQLTRMMFPYLILVSLVAWAMGILNAESRFAAPAAAPALLNLGIIGAAFAVSPFLDQPIFGIALGVILGGLLQVLLQVPALRETGQPLLPLSFKGDPRIRRMMLILGPAVLGAGVYQVNIIVLRNLASFLPDGQVTHYYNASRLTELVTGVFAFGILSASLPELSRNSARGEWENISKTLRMSVASTLILVVPASVGLFVMAEPIVSMLFLHGAYGSQDVQSTAATLRMFALGIPAVAVIRLQTSVFYVLKDTKTPVLAASVSIPLTGMLGWYLSTITEVSGLALGLSAGTFFQLFLLNFRFYRQPELNRIWWPGRSVLNALVCSVPVGCSAWFLSDLGIWENGPFDLSNWMVLLGTMLLCTLLYGLLLWIFSEEQLIGWISGRRKGDSGKQV